MLIISLVPKPPTVKARLTANVICPASTMRHAVRYGWNHGCDHSSTVMVSLGENPVCMYCTVIPDMSYGYTSVSQIGSDQRRPLNSVVSTVSLADDPRDATMTRLSSSSQMMADGITGATFTRGPRPSAPATPTAGAYVRYLSTGSFPSQGYYYVLTSEGTASTKAPNVSVVDVRTTLVERNTRPGALLLAMLCTPFVHHIPAPRNLLLAEPALCPGALLTCSSLGNEGVLGFIYLRPHHGPSGVCL
jgi:hypothetical protein